MYRRDMGRQWLEESISGKLELSLVTRPVLSEELQAYEVSPLVNSPENDSPECVRRVQPPTEANLSLFITFREGDHLVDSHHMCGRHGENDQTSPMHLRGAHSTVSEVRVIERAGGIRQEDDSVVVK